MLEQKTHQADDTMDNNVMITDITKRRKDQSVGVNSGSTVKTTGSSPTKKSVLMMNAFNVMTKMGLNTCASNPQIMQALKIMQKTKSKRGPKEKATFQRFIYCLPDKSAKLPRFRSTDDLERAIVKQQQDQGYGYPPNDYNNGYPHRTHIDIHLSAEEFDAFLKTIYPKLVSRYYDMYKIDIQKRLLRIETLTPRAIKDMKYQGHLIIIPYDDPNFKPPATLHRCISDNHAFLEYSHLIGSDETTSLSLSDHHQIIETITSSVNTSIASHKTPPKQVTEQEPVVIKIETDSSDVEMEGAVGSSSMNRAQKVECAPAAVQKEPDTMITSQPASLKGVVSVKTGKRKRKADLQLSHQVIINKIYW